MPRRRASRHPTAAVRARVTGLEIGAAVLVLTLLGIYQAGCALTALGTLVSLASLALLVLDAAT